MKISEASARSGVTPKMVRYYESIGLFTPTPRRENAYRDFDERDVHDLRFIKRARTLGFSIEEIQRLLALWRDRDRPSREVKAIAARHIEDLETRIGEMQAMVATLAHLSRNCHGDNRPDCPILDELARKPSGDQPGEDTDRGLA